VLAVPLREAPVTIRAEGPVDEPSDVWGGVIPIRRVADAPVWGDDSHADVPEDVARREADPGG
jgi:hypothetical protein